MDGMSQTDWKYPRNANTQYEAREFSEEQKSEIMKRHDLRRFVEGVIPRWVYAVGGMIVFMVMSVV